MEEVITKGEGIITLFPQLKYLNLVNLPKLGHFFLTEHALTFPFLEEVFIDDCPEMKTFLQHGISVITPSLKSDNDNDEMEVDSLTKCIQQLINNKHSLFLQEQQATTKIVNDNKASEEDKVSDDDEAEPSHARS
ncbi:hypothetical protein EJD97_015157 [Solanum chilense]|uniref:NB-ARC domain-containing protein n=1 Tax=Solanum chilense TaxID=4083 RepID=A0A6N2ALI3_SOLCI|nr:hypothetical protein EJD97_015157 [Solanum chilense]